jgi:hypothetical protein
MSEPLGDDGQRHPAVQHLRSHGVAQQVKRSTPRLRNLQALKQSRYCWGLSWQITPRALTEALAAGGAEAKRAFEAMMTLTKIDIATIEAARRG